MLNISGWIGAVGSRSKAFVCVPFTRAVAGGVVSVSHLWLVPYLDHKRRKRQIGEYKRQTLGRSGWIGTVGSGSKALRMVPKDEMCCVSRKGFQMLVNCSE